ncbi:uncharacterized protein LOC124173522 [Ischnura elegans]|uniref:uncharacterized protein LOC124173522 n=1 Tax=Ischnura elegans TaxID=197161 RepID=UPI001ED89450|nr:uncharacterized protein LOC124173522 [Ischnura elegans]
MAALLLQLNLQPITARPQQHFLVRHLEPIFREDLIPDKNRPPPGPHGGATRAFATFNPHANEYGSRVTPHSHLVLYLGGGRPAPGLRGQIQKSPPPEPAPQFGGNFGAGETHPLFHYGYPFEPLPLLGSPYFLNSHPLHF